MQEQDRSRRYVRYHVLGPEIVHAPGGLDRNLHNRLRRKIFPQRFRNGDCTEPADPHALTRFGLLLSTLFQQPRETSPGLRGRMLSSKLALAVTPAAGRDHT